MINTLAKFLIRINKFKIEPVVDSYLETHHFSKPPKMTFEIIKTNYFSQSPFLNTNLIALSQKNDLLIWYTQDDSKKIKIPEALLLFRVLLLKDQNDRIIVFRTETNDSLIVIKNSQLIAQSATSKLTDDFIERLRKQYSVNKVERLSKLDYDSCMKSSFAALTLDDWIQLIHFERPNISSLSQSIQKLAIPISVAILLMLGFHYGQNYLLTQKLEETRLTFTEGKGTIIPIKQKMKNIQNHNEHWNKFITNDIIRPDALTSVEPLLKSVKKTKSAIKYVKISGATLETVIETPKATEFLKDLMKDPRYQDVRLEFSKTDPLRSCDSAKIVLTISPFDTNGSIQ